MAKKPKVIPYPYECKKCFGWGLYWTPESSGIEPFPVTTASAIKNNFATVKCQSCGANYKPNGLKIVPTWL